MSPSLSKCAAGNASNALSTTPVSLDLQEVMGTGTLPSGPIEITGMSFRAAPGAGPISATVGSLSVYLSNSLTFPNTGGGAPLMSTTLANNIGPARTLVYSGGNVTWSDSGCAAPGPCPFDINIVFTQPFYYDPSMGPLLIDMLETNFAARSGAADAQSFSARGGPVAQVFATLGSKTGTFSYQGNIVQLTYLGPAAAGSPSFTGVVNPANNIPPGFPNSGIAQSSIFVAYGNDLGPASLVQATLLPLANNLGGTAITVAVNGTTVNAPIVYTSAGQVAAVLPSTTPLGAGTLTLAYNGNSATTPINVVASNFGISTVNESGSGAAVVTFPNYAVVSNTNSAKPGDTLVLWGTGLGPLPVGQSDAS